jgi:tagaturonate reductase
LSSGLVQALREGQPTGARLPPDGTVGLPIRTIQFGEGKFLRAFVEPFFQSANEAGLGLGGIGVVQPIPKGWSAELASQDCLYTVGVQGLDPDTGETIDSARVMGSVSASLSAYDHWQEVVSLAQSERVRFVISNTTEAGIALDPLDGMEQAPPRSFPAKVTMLLYHRYRKLGGDHASPLVFLPCELIERNGGRLRECVSELIDRWKMGGSFKEWATRRNVYLSTLVDRIVTGPPERADRSRWRERLGFEDRLLDLAEPFHLWLIQGDPSLEEELPFRKAGLSVRFVADLGPYRRRKVRLLNGAHTALTALGLLASIETVGQAMSRPDLARLVEEMMEREICPTLSVPLEEAIAFGRQVRRRFRNPFVAHRLADISLNTSSKMKVRLLPSLLDVFERTGRAPSRLCLAFAANLMLYDPSSKTSLTPEDDPERTRTLKKVWRSGEAASPEEMRCQARRFLELAELWGYDLAQHSEIVDKVGEALWILRSGSVEEGIDWACEHPTPPRR